MQRDQSNILAAPHDDLGKTSQTRWTPCTICLIVGIILLSLLSIALLSILLIHVLNWSESCDHEPCKIIRPALKCNKTGQDICTTKDCVLTASTFLEAMDTSVNPCENFFEFTCGRYIQQNPVPDNALAVSSLFQFQDFYNRQLRDLIEDADTLREPPVVGRAQEAYHVCLNTSYQPKLEFNAFKTFVNSTLGGWPYAEGSDWRPRWSLEEFLGRIQRIGFSYGFGEFYSGPDLKDKRKKNTWLLHMAGSSDSLVQPALISEAAGDDDDDDDDDENDENGDEGDEGSDEDDSSSFLEAYKKLISSVADKLRTPGTTASFWDKAGFTLLQARILKLKTDNSDVLQNVLDAEALTLKEMNKIGKGKVDWLKIINTKFEGIHTFQETDVILTDREYVKKVSKLLSETSFRSLANFIVWKIMLNLLPYAGPDIENDLQDFIKTIDPSYEEPTRWKTCTAWIQESYTYAVTRIFVKKHVDQRAKQVVSEMIETIRDAYKQTIEQSSWLDAETKRRALIKADKMKQFVSYPDFIFDDQSLETYYNYIPSLNSIHFNNVIDSIVNASIKEMKEFVQPGSLIVYKWTRNPLEINAFYDPMSNSIWFPSGILQLPSFDATRPAAVNYGMTGSTIGHEIGHGFDDSGSTFDEYGQIQQWWTNDTRQKYKELTQCYVEQYSEFCPEDLQGGDENICVDGEQTLGENIADNTGVKAAFMAYKEWVRKHGVEKRLPGLQEYTPEQIFFISYGYIWCENVPTDKWISRFEDDAHSPGKYRTNGVLQNMEEFAKVFKCPVGPMNRASECKLW